MATGDQADFLSRIKAALPGKWFPDTTPILDGVLSGPSYAAAWTYSTLAFVRAQARRLTASGIYLDLIATDFFNGFIRRSTNESDASLSRRIGLELFREKGTRAGLIRALTDLTGHAPIIFEPEYPLDTGGYSVGGVGYNVAGGYGSLLLPYQFFVTAFRPAGLGLATVAGYGHIGGAVGMPGGYGVGAIEYASLAMVTSTVLDQDILNVINDVRPAGSTAWTKISGAAIPNTLDSFILDLSTLG